MKLAERETQLSNKFWVREIRKLTESGHQTALLTTNFQAPDGSFSGVVVFDMGRGKVFPLHATAL